MLYVQGELRRTPSLPPTAEVAVSGPGLGRGGWDGWPSMEGEPAVLDHRRARVRPSAYRDAALRRHRITRRALRVLAAALADGG